MKHLALLAVVLSSPFVQAQLVAVDRGVGERLPVMIERFQSEAVIVPAVFLNPREPQSAPLMDVYLDADVLGLPLTKGVPFQVKPESSRSALLEGEFPVPVPATGRPVLLRLVFRNGPAAPAMGSVRLKVLPREMLKEALAARIGGSLKLCLFGELKGLRELLRSWRIPFQEEGADPPLKIAGGTLALGSSATLDRLPGLLPGASLICLLSDPGMEEGIATKETASTRQTLIRSSGAEDWRTSVRLHRLLLNHLELPDPKP